MRHCDESRDGLSPRDHSPPLLPRLRRGDRRDRLDLALERGSVRGRYKPRAANDPLAPKPPHFKAKAKNVIYLFMAGVPSQLDLFDSKPKLVEYNGKAIPDEFTKGERFAFIKGTPKLLGSPYKFQKHGQSGVEFSELLPHLAEVADEVAVVRSLVTDAFNHAPASFFSTPARPNSAGRAWGFWLTYGLGSESRDLPGFVVFISGGGQPDGGASCWSSGFLPTLYQGVTFRSQGDPVLFLSNPAGMNPADRRRLARRASRFESRPPCRRRRS